jgi:hypothetical protein
MAYFSNHYVTIEVRIAWWVKPYLHVLSVLCDLFDTYPDPDKLQSTLLLGVETKIKCTA